MSNKINWQEVETSFSNLLKSIDRNDLSIIDEFEKTVTEYFSQDEIEDKAKKKILITEYFNKVTSKLQNKLTNLEKKDDKFYDEDSEENINLAKGASFYKKLS